MTDAAKLILKKRFFSFLWKMVSMVTVYFIAFVMANISMFGWPVIIVTIIGLIGSEITKALMVNFPKLNEELNK